MIFLLLLLFNPFMVFFFYFKSMFKSRENAALSAAFLTKAITSWTRLAREAEACTSQANFFLFCISCVQSEPTCLNPEGI